MIICKIGGKVVDIDQFNKSFKNKEYLKGRGAETEYYIITAKLGNKRYKLTLLRNNTIIEESYHEGLTKAKYSAFEWLLNHDSLIFEMNKVTMVHYKEDRPNEDPWVKDTNIELHRNLEAYLRDVKVRPEKSIQKEMTITQVINNQRRIEEAIQFIEEKEITETEREQVIKSRIGQSTFKKELLHIEKKCGLCGVSDERFLVASHIKPWSQSNNQERLDVNNGLLLCPNHDALFDKGYISFANGGTIMISDSLDEATKVFLNINESMNIKMNGRQRQYMQWHRENIFTGF